MRQLVFIWFCLLTTLQIFASKRVEFYVNWSIDLNPYRRALAEVGLDYDLVYRPLEKALPQGYFLDPDIHKVICFNFPTSWEHLGHLPKEKMVLFAWEPPTVLPHLYSKEVHDLFSKVYTFHDGLVDGHHYFKFYYPRLKPMIETLPPFDEKKFCTFIGGNRDSIHPHQLYGERIRSIKYFEEKEPGEFFFYGRWWDPNIYPSYLGAIPDKVAVNKHYKFTICYENIRELSGYITEKIFDCFAAGSIPIYWGANNVDEYIPLTCFIDRRNFTCHDELYAYLKGMGEEEYEEYLSNIRAFLMSEKAHLFTMKKHLEIFVDAVKDQSQPPV